MTAPFPIPATYVLELTQRCNHDCPHCYNAWKNPVDYPDRRLDTAGTLALIEKLLGETEASLITLTGGEPMLRSDLFEIVDFLTERKVSINIISNGTLLTDDAIARLIPDKVSIFELPLLSADRKIHDRMSGAGGAFDKVTAAMAELKLRRQRVVGVFVATKLNLPTWKDTFELAVALGLDGIMFNRFNPGGTGRENVEALQLSPEELQSALDVAEEMSEQYEFSVSCPIAMPPCLIQTDRYKRIGFGFCAAGTDRAYYTLDPVGNVRPCNHSPTILGNLREMTLREMLAGQPMRDFVAARPDFCAGCAVENVCLGGCKAAAEACCGSVQAMDPFLSAFHPHACKP